MPDELAERRRVFRALVPYFATTHAADFFRNTGARVADVERIHPLIEGIYKPAGFIYPLAITSMLRSRYSDQLFHNPDRTWSMEYSPKAGGMNLAVNAGLVRCMTDKEPVLVLRQESDKSERCRVALRFARTRIHRELRSGGRFVSCSRTDVRRSRRNNWHVSI